MPRVEQRRCRCRVPTPYNMLVNIGTQMYVYAYEMYATGVHTYMLHTFSYCIYVCTVRSSYFSTPQHIEFPTENHGEKRIDSALNNYVSCSRPLECGVDRSTLVPVTNQSLCLATHLHSRLIRHLFKIRDRYGAPDFLPAHQQRLLWREG